MTVEAIIQEKRKTPAGQKQLETRLFEKLNVSKRHFIRLKKGQTKLSLQHATVAAEVLQVPIAKLKNEE